MVRLTVANILRGTSIYNKKRVDESTELALKRITHLHLEDMSIDDIGDDIRNCRNLLVLYLYDNKLPRFPNLGGCTQLTHLYLQNNQICQLEFIQFLPSLQHLYLSRNKISLLEGLHVCTMLEELLIDYQDLPGGEKLLFEPRSIAALSRSLRVLNVSGNRIDTLVDLQGLMRLENFSARDNKLRSLTDLKGAIVSWPSLKQLDLQDNDVCKRKRYHEMVVGMCRELENLDDREINESFKAFIMNLQDRRALSIGTKMSKTGSVSTQATLNSDALPEPNVPLQHLHFGRLYGPSNGDTNGVAQARSADGGSSLPRLPRSYAEIPAHLKKQKKNSNGHSVHYSDTKTLRESAGEVELTFAVTAASAPVHLRQLRKSAEAGIIGLDGPSNTFTFEQISVSPNDGRTTSYSIDANSQSGAPSAREAQPINLDAKANTVIGAESEIGLSNEPTSVSIGDQSIWTAVSSSKPPSRFAGTKPHVRFHSAPGNHKRALGLQNPTSHNRDTAVISTALEVWLMLICASSACYTHGLFTLSRRVHFSSMYSRVHACLCMLSKCTFNSIYRSEITHL